MEATELRHILDVSVAFKSGNPPSPQPLRGQTLAMIFEKPSTRTRVAFEVAMAELGGQAIVMNPSDTQLGRGETFADTARVLSRYVDAIMIRTTRESVLEELAANADIPVINGLTNRSHPCQLMADIMTFEEHRGTIRGKQIAWCGDGNNVARTWIEAAARFGFDLRLACPAELRPAQETVDWAMDQGAKVCVTSDPQEAVEGSHCVVTDTWVSMGDGDTGKRRTLLEPYQVDESLMSLARDDAIFMHCLPAQRGKEVTGDVLDGPHSVVWDEAENRLHAHKGILFWCLAQ